jgi:hypothetical protein
VLWVARTHHRLTYLERFIVLCAWCRRVRSDQVWVSIDEFLHQRQATTSHGLCPDCQTKVNAEIDAVPAASRPGLDP